MSSSNSTRSSSCSLNSKSKNMMPCAACKLLRRRCTKDCIFLPYFPSSEPHKFAAVHHVFGASNIAKMLQEIPGEERGDAVMSLVYEATTRLKQPVYGCVALISSLQNQVLYLQSQLHEAHAQAISLKTQLSTLLLATSSTTTHDDQQNQQHLNCYNTCTDIVDSSTTSTELLYPPPPFIDANNNPYIN